MKDSYTRNKLKTTFDIFQTVENWPEAIVNRLTRNGKKSLSLLRFRRGISFVIRNGTKDWDLLHELLYAGGYRLAFDYLKGKRGAVIDLGGNIGSFSLLCAQGNNDVALHSFEPGPQNIRMFRMNLLANPDLASNIQIHEIAVSGTDSTANWFFDEENPGASSLYSARGVATPVTVKSLKSVLDDIPGPISLLKIDVEGAEYEILEGTPLEYWQRIPAIALEVHENPSGKMNPSEYLDAYRKLGYTVQPESVVSYFLRRD